MSSSAEHFPVVIYHHEGCGTSKNVLEQLIVAGHTPTVVNYLETGWTRSQLLGLLAAAGLRARDALRIKGSPAEELGLLGVNVGEETLLEAMVAEPNLVNRPFVCTPKGVRLVRPIEVLADLI